MAQKRRGKIGRNDECPCQSGKKYKYCHGDLKNIPIPHLDVNKNNVERQKALDIQKKLQQGHGKSIVATEYNEDRVVAVANQIYRGKWLTFHDFLCHYIQSCMGKEWGNGELKKTEEKRHPLIQLYKLVCDYQRTFIKKLGQVNSAPFTGATAAYTWLSYNLYLIAHNVTLQQSLINRLRDAKQFPGAYYETYVAAIFIKAGFILEFEDESDKSTSHCEFTATHKKTGKKYSVEAKLRHRKSLFCPDASNNFNLRIGTPLHRALEKKALHERIIFIDLSLPTSEIEKHSEDSLIRLLKKHEQDLINGRIAPPAYVFITNHPYHYDLEDTNQKVLYLAEGFNIPNLGKREVTLHESIQARKQHQPIHDLWDSIKTHTNIPVTFDGELPEFAFSKPKNRLLIGQEYLVNLSGTEQLVELQQATVDIQNQKAWGLCKNSNGQCQLIEFPLTKEELKAYKQSPDTFFDVYRRQGKMLNTPLEMYDFFRQGFSQITKEKLLEHLKAHPSYQQLLTKNRDELLEIYCANITNSAYLKQSNNNPD